MKLVIDGLTVNVADDQSGGIIEKHIASLTSQLSSVKDSFEDFKKKKKTDDDEAAETKKTYDAKDGEIAVLKKQLDDAKVTPEKLDLLVKDRLAVVDKAKTLVDKAYVFDGKTVEQIRKDAVTAHLGDAIAKHLVNDGAIEGAFLAIDAKKGVTATTQIGDALRGRPHTVANVSDASDMAYEEMLKRQSNAWKTPGGVA